MSQQERKRYTAEFKTQAVALIQAGRPVAKRAEDCDISTNFTRSNRVLAAAELRP